MYRSPTSILVISTVLLCASCSRKAPVVSAPVPDTSAPSPGPLRKGKETTMQAVSFLEERVKSDSDDFVALNKLAGYYLKLHRETDDVNYLSLALQTAKASLKVLPADQNLSGLAALAQAEFETHNFQVARDLARELTEYQPHKSFGFQLLGDSLLELGDYDEAARVYEQMEKLDPGTTETEARLAHLALLRGDLEKAQKGYEFALAQAKNASLPSEETIAWCYWQLGEFAFGVGKLEESARYYQDAIKTVENYPHAVASLARTRMAQGKLPEAIKLYESVLGQPPDPGDAFALGDAYKLAGRERESAKLYELATEISQRDALHLTLYNRHLVLYWANNGVNVERAYELARREYDKRRDIFGADALAWTAFKSGRVPEAYKLMEEALRLGTQDAKLFYHAGMIAKAAGEKDKAVSYLQRSYKLNPHYAAIANSMALQ